MRFLRTHPRLRSHSVRLRLCSSAQPISRTGSLLRVKLRRTQYEHMFSALPSSSDIARRSRHVSNVPEAVIR
jgi:hypothetical protein